MRAWLRCISPIHSLTLTNAQGSAKPQHTHSWLFMAALSFIESPFATKVAYEEWVASGADAAELCRRLHLRCRRHGPFETW